MLRKNEYSRQARWSGILNDSSVNSPSDLKTICLHGRNEREVHRQADNQRCCELRTVQIWGDHDLMRRRGGLGWPSLGVERLRPNARPRTTRLRT